MSDKETRDDKRADQAMHPSNKQMAKITKKAAPKKGGRKGFKGGRGGKRSNRGF